MTTTIDRVTLRMGRIQFSKIKMRSTFLGWPSGVDPELLPSQGNVQSRYTMTTVWQDGWDSNPRIGGFGDRCDCRYATVLGLPTPHNAEGPGFRRVLRTQDVSSYDESYLFMRLRGDVHEIFA